jgi:DNA-binding MarR family transcriptional regulator
MELLFDHQRIAYALEARMNAELISYKLTQLQMWLLLLIGGFHRGTMRGRKELSADESATELCIERTRVSNEFTRLAKRGFILAVTPKKGADKRGRRFVLTFDGEILARDLRALLQKVEKDMLVSAGCRAMDRAVDPQCLLVGLWLCGAPKWRLPTLTRLQNASPALVAGMRRGEDRIRLKKKPL